MPTPPTGLARQAAPAVAAPAVAAPAVAGPVPCPRCATPNPAHMRFCINCGFQVQAPPAVAAPPNAPAAAPPIAAPARPAEPPTPPVCWRCRAVGYTDADFCKFCGARYADGAAAAPAVAAVEPAPRRPEPVHVPPPSAPLPRAPEPAPVLQPPPSIGGAVAAYAHQQPVAARPPLAVLVAILKDGSDGRAHAVHDETCDIGQKEGAIVLPDDPYLSARHARLVVRPDGLLLRDLDSVNGVYVRLREPVELADGDQLLLGQQVLRFEILPEMELPLGPGSQRGVLVFGTPEVPRIARLVQYTTEGVARDVHYLYRDETVLGREQGDIVCTDDPFMSRRHAAVTIDRAARRFTLRDLGSSNGTAFRIRGERLLKPGDQFRVGRHLFRYDSGASPVRPLA